jgi:excisionase family DNA binding protein
MLEDYLTVQEVAKLYNREESVIRRACINKWIKAVKIGHQWLIHQDDAREHWKK